MYIYKLYGTFGNKLVHYSELILVVELGYNTMSFAMLPYDSSKLFNKYHFQIR